CAVVHGAVTVWKLIQTNDPIEYPARLDLALEHIGKQLLNVRADRGGAAADSEVVVERRLRGGDRLVVGDANAAHGATRTGDADRGAHGLAGADALEGGVDGGGGGPLPRAAGALPCPLADAGPRL